MTKSSIKSKKYNLSTNIFTSIIIPIFVVSLAIVIAIFFGFNKGMDFNGGLLVSVVTDQYNLEDSEEYNKFKGEVDKVLESNGVCGSVYLTEKHTEYQDDVLVVKIEYSSNQNTEKIIEGIKSGLVSKFYAGEESFVEQNHLVVVSTFGPSVDSFKIVISILATLVTIIAICIYIGLRSFSVHTPIIALLASTISSVLSFALIMLSRIKTYAYSLSILPLVSVVSCISVFMFATKFKQLLKSGMYEKKSNADVSNHVIKQNKIAVICLGIVSVIAGLVFTISNITSTACYLGLSIIVATVSVVYTNVFIIPALYALTYVRKVKKEKAKKEQITNKLDEAEVLKETDLDNLVSN